MNDMRTAAYEARDRRIRKAARELREHGFSGTLQELAQVVAERLRCYYRALPLSEVMEVLEAWERRENEPKPH